MIILTLIALLIAGVIGIGIAQMFVWRDTILSAGGYRAYFAPWLNGHKEDWVSEWKSMHPFWRYYYCFLGLVVLLTIASEL